MSKTAVEPLRVDVLMSAGMLSVLDRSVCIVMMRLTLPILSSPEPTTSRWTTELVACGEEVRLVFQNQPLGGTHLEREQIYREVSTAKLTSELTPRGMDPMVTWSAPLYSHRAVLKTKICAGFALCALS